MSLALYRKYRPGRLDEVVGQDHVVEPLKRALANDRVHHAYLFSGPRGCGKTSSARVLARSLNCESGPTPDPCGECNSCRDLAPNGPGSIDVIELDAATHGLVDDARDLREKAVYAPAASRYKIYIIDEAHQLGPGAANALLKLVEEPPPHVRFVFATTEPEKIIATIRSRTHHYAFRLVPAPILKSHLAKICQAEGIPAEPTALALVVRAATGSVRDALSILGQLLASAPEAGLSYEDAASQLGVTDAVLIDRFVEGLASADGAQLFRAVDQVIDQGLDPRRFVTDVLERLRDLIVILAVPDAGDAGLVAGPPEQVERLGEQARTFDSAALSTAADLVSRGLSDLKGATAPRLQLELLAARLLAPAPVSSADEMAAQIAELQRRIVGGPRETSPQPTAHAAAAPPRLSDVAGSTAGSSESPTPEPKHATRGEPASAVASLPNADLAASAPASAPAPAPVSAAEPSAVSIDQVAALWPAILEQVKSDSRVAWMLVTAAKPIAVSGAAVTAVHADAGTIARFRQSGHATRIAHAISTVIGAEVTLELIHDPSHSGSSSSQKPTGGKPTEADVDVTESTDADDLSGVELVQRELGATKITEYDEA